MEVQGVPGCGEPPPGQGLLQPPTMVTERMAARAAATIVALDVVAFGAPVVVVVHARTRLCRVICRDLGHSDSPFEIGVDRIKEGPRLSREARPRR